MRRLLGSEGFELFVAYMCIFGCLFGLGWLVTSLPYPDEDIVHVAVAVATILLTMIIAPRLHDALMKVVDSFVSPPVNSATGIALAMYSDEPCRICGKLLSREDMNDAAHGHCWNSNQPKQEWAYPHDAK